jgi:hypothetical protein
VKVVRGALVVGLLAACSANRALHPDGAAGADGTKQIVIELPGAGPRDLDVLFMVDNSTGMTFDQQKLIASFPEYVASLVALPGGMPNLHLAVVSSSLGAGRTTDIPHCAPGGDRGMFHSLPRGSCGSSGLPDGQTFITSIDGVNNFTGDLATVLACIAFIGSSGCGFEHQLASISRALGADGQPAPSTNAGFLRPNAYLQIVALTDEDDCSAPPDSDLFDTSSQTISDPLGPLQSYRCNEFGHLCGGKPPPRQMAADLSGTCVSNEHGRLLPVGELVRQLEALKAEPSKVFVAAIAGPPTPYVVSLGPAQVKGDTAEWPFVERSCVSTDTLQADPAVRLAQWVDAFGDNGLFESACSDSYKPVLSAIGAQLGKAFAPPCLEAGIDASTCTLVDHFARPPDAPIDDVLSACDATVDQAPCWSVEASSRECPTGQSFRINRGGTSALPDSTTATCLK